ncbi:hypothetical protein Tco_0935402, partial [Tanacetum coccineum]
SQLELFVIVIHFIEYLAHYLLKAPFGGVIDWYPSQGYREPGRILAAPVISISSDLSDESVRSSIPRVILIGSISVEVSIAPEVEASVVASPAGVLDTYSSSETDPSESDSESDTEMPERHVSPTPHDVTFTRWRSRVASRSSSPTTSTPEIPTAPILPALSAVVAPSTDIISPIDAPPGIHQRRAILI